MSLRQNAFFPSGTDVIAKDTYPTLEKLANVIRSLPNPVQLEGHTDSVPIHNGRFKSNWELSSAPSDRHARSSVHPFDCRGIGLPVVGRADTAPLDTDDTPEGRMRNRASTW